MLINPTNNESLVVSQKKGLQRNTIDKYYTKPSVAEQCIAQIQQTLQIDKNDVIIEPSAGNGAFIPFIQPLVNTSLFFDIAPEHPSIIQQNYLEYEVKRTEPHSGSKRFLDSFPRISEADSEKNTPPTTNFKGHRRSPKKFANKRKDKGYLY